MTRVMLELDWLVSTTSSFDFVAQSTTENTVQLSAVLPCQRYQTILEKRASVFLEKSQNGERSSKSL